MADCKEKGDVELEEGELDTDDDDVPGHSLETNSGPKISEANSQLRMPTQGFRKPAGSDSSEESSNDSDDSTEAWRSNRKKKRVEGMDTSAPQAILSKDQSSRKVNNVWGAVLQEQTLTQTLGGLGVDPLDESLQMDRDVENYDFTLAKLDPRPHKAKVDLPLESNDPFDKLIELDKFGDISKRGTKRRWANKDKHHQKSKPAKTVCSVELTDSESKVLSVIVTELDEPNVELFGRMVHILGEEKSMELLRLTKEKEADGGILTYNQDRRRTAGGVYIYLLKNQGIVEPQTIKEIFIEDFSQKQKDHRRRRRRNRRRQQHESSDLSTDIRECLEKKKAELEKELEVEMDEPENKLDMEEPEIKIEEPEIKIEEPEPEMEKSEIKM